MSDPTQAAELLALDVWDFISDYCHDPASVTDEKRSAIRTAAFSFSREVTPSEAWQVAFGRRLAHAALKYANDATPEHFRALERCSRQFEQLRLSPPPTY
jgi:predicted HD phosphohydrolase